MAFDHIFQGKLSRLHKIQQNLQRVLNPSMHTAQHKNIFTTKDNEIVKLTFFISTRPLESLWNTNTSVLQRIKGAKKTSKTSRVLTLQRSDLLRLALIYRYASKYWKDVSCVILVDFHQYHIIIRQSSCNK